MDLTQSLKQKCLLSFVIYHDDVSVARLTHRTLQKAGLPPLWPGVYCTGAQAGGAEGGS